MIAVGVELAETCVRIAVVEGGPRGARVKAFDVLRLDGKDGEAEDDIVSVIQEGLRRVKAPTGNVVASIRAQDCMVREIVVPFTDDDKIRKTIKYQAESYFTSLSIDDLVIDYSKFAEVETKSKLLVAGIRKSHVARRLALLEEAGVDPIAVDLDVAALFNTYVHLDVLPESGACLIVDIGKDTLRIGVVDEGKLRLARSVRMRLASMRLDGHRPLPKMDESIADTHADESARLPVVILDEGDEDAFSLDDSQISETERAGILHRVFMEIDRTVASVQLSHDIDLICLTGPSCRLEGVEQVFSDHFEIDARRVDLAGPLDADDGDGKRAPSVSLEGGVAVGLALKALGIDHAGFDFRQEELAYRGTFGQLKKALACALTLLFALTFLYAFSLKEELRQEKNYLRGVQTLQENVYTVAFPNLADDSSPYLPLPGGTSDFGYAMQNQFAELQAKYGGGGGGDDGPNVSALEVLRQFALCKAKVAARWKVEVIKSSIDPRPSGQSRFVCTTTDQPGAIELTKQFEQNEVVSGFAREVRRDKRTGKWSFEFIVKLRQEEG